MIGLEAAKKFYETASYPDGRRKWRPNWRFFLPHGVPMINHKTVQLLHFPPDSVLLHDRDYLAANTTKRWAQLLEASGAKRDETDQYQNIIDIAPIAAPHADGGKLEGSYSYFTKYIKKLLELWLYKQNGGKPRPLIAFGTAVKEWLKAEYGVDIKGRPPQARKIKIGPHEVPTLLSYHPSYIWAAVSRKKDNPWTPDDELLGYAMKVMLPDATAAYWQVEMAKNPTLDPNAVLADAEQYWLKTENVRALCKLAYQQVWRKRKETAECLSNDFVDNQLLAFAADDKTWDQFSASVLPRQPWLHISDEEMELLSKSIGSNDSSVQPDDF